MEFALDPRFDTKEYEEWLDLCDSDPISPKWPEGPEIIKETDVTKTKKDDIPW